MKSILLVFVCLFCRTVLADAHYSVKIDPDRPRNVSVVASVTPSEQGLCFSRASSDMGLTHGWATFVHQLVIENVEGEPLEAEYDGGDCWQLSVLDKVIVSYTMLLQHDQFPIRFGRDEAAYAGDWGQFWTGRALFVEGAPEANIEVEFALLPGWNVTAPWPASEDSTMLFRPPNSDALLDSGFMLGTHESQQIVLGRSTIHIGLSGAEPIKLKKDLTAIVDEALAMFSELHRAVPPEGDIAIFLGQGSGSRGGGGVMGRTISIIVPEEEPEKLIPIFTHIVTHEVFHLWNASLNYADQEDMYWFSEGFAEYFTFLGMQQLSWIDKAKLLETFNERGNLYAETVGQISMVDAGKKKFDHYHLIYSGGMMAALALDMQILGSTDGMHRLSDILPTIYEEYGSNSEINFDNAVLVNSIKEKTGINVEQLFRDYVSGVKTIDVDAFIARLSQTL